jgi:hypothetical protein
MKVLSVLLGILLPALGSAAPIDARLGFDGLGKAKIGLSFDDVRHLWPDEIQPLDDGLKASAHCYHISPSKHRQISLMFRDERLARVDLTAKPGQTTDGIRIGDGIAAVKRRYPKLVITGQDEQQATATSGDKQHAIRFYLLNGVVTSLSAGDVDAVALDEGCN